MYSNFLRVTEMKWKFFVVFFVIAIVMCCLTNAEEPQRKENSLIPRNLFPLEYILLFEIDMADETNLFTGTATIKMRCLQRTTEIVLNAKNLEINKKDVHVEKESVRCSRKDFFLFRCIFPKNTSSGKTKQLAIKNQGPDEEREWYKIVLKKKLKEDDVVTVRIKYRKLASLQHSDMAFIKYSYKKESNGEEKFLAVSRSGAIHARRLYPCVDMRNFRAPITVMISHHRNFESVSNTDFEVDAEHSSVATDSELTDIVVDEYNPTQPMSTFLVGLVVGNLKLNGVADKRSSYGVRIWADKSIIGQTTYAKVMATKIFEYYQEYFKSKRLVYKVDIVALPNYGYTDKWMLDLITLDESMITNLKPWKEIREIEIAFQLCDVLSHQYFGPRTIISNWTENWLNIGLALFFRAPCFEKILPKEKKSLVIIDETESFIRISDADPKRIFHHLTLDNNQINLNTLFENSALADTAYSLVRMLNSIVSEEYDVLLEGAQKYISDSRDKVFNLNEIWYFFHRGDNSYSIPEHETIVSIMENWISTNAITVIKLTRDEGEEMVTVTQEPLETDRNGKKIYKYVPLNYATKSELSNSNYERVKKWVKDQPVKMKRVLSGEWIIHDSRFDVLCRHVYDESILNLIEETLSSESQHTTIPDLARAQLISDMFAIAEMEKYPDYTYSMVFRILEYLKHERSLPPLMVALHELNKIRLRLLNFEALHPFQDYVKIILQNIIDGKQYKKISEFGQTDYTEYYLKILIVRSACTFQVKSFVDQSIKLFKAWKLADSMITFDAEYNQESIRLRDSSYPEIVRQYINCQAMRKGVLYQWEFLWGFYYKKNAGKSDDILNALACTTNREQLEKYLEWSIDTKKIAVEDSLTVFKSLGTNVKGYPLMYAFLQKNLNDILEVHKDNLSNVYSYWKYLYEITMTQEDFDKLENFTKSVTSRVQNIETHLEESRKKAKKNISWLKNNGRNIYAFVKSFRKYDEEETTVEG